MDIDIVATAAKEVEEAGGRVGDPIVPLAPFQVLASGRTYLAKAFDERAGWAVLVEGLRRLAREGHPNTVYGVATVQEEVGLRGGGYQC